MLPGTHTNIVSQIGERERYAGLSDGLREYVRMEFRGDPGAVRAWIASARAGASAGALRTATRAAAQALTRAVRAFAATVANPGGG